MQTVNLNFNLPDEDEDWPPVTTESLPFENLGGGRYRLLVAPLFVRDLSVDDVLLIEVSAEGIVWEWQYESRSKHSTIWVIDAAQSKFEKVVSGLQGLGCKIVRAPMFDVYSIDVPGEIARESLEEWLDLLDEESVGYPSYRYEE